MVSFTHITQDGQTVHIVLYEQTTIIIFVLVTIISSIFKGAILNF